MPFVCTDTYKILDFEGNTIIKEIKWIWHGFIPKNPHAYFCKVEMQIEENLYFIKVQSDKHNIINKLLVMQFNLVSEEYSIYKTVDISTPKLMIYGS